MTNAKQDNTINEPPHHLSTGALLRCAADDELTPAQRADLDAHLAATPDDAGRIRFECELRTACCRVLSAESAPASLRSRIAAHAAAASTTNNTNSPPRPAHAPAPTPQVVVAGRIGPSFLQRWGFAIAATLMMTAAVGLLVRGGLLTQSAPPLAAGPESPVVLVANYLSDEHQRCTSDDKALSRRLTPTDLSRAPEAMKKVLGQPVSVESMAEAGFDLIGTGSCSVPGAPASMHLVFRRAGDDGKHIGPAVSLFIEPNTGRLDLEEGVTYAVEEGDRGSARVVAWLNDGFVYYLVTKCSVSCDAARHGMDAPTSIAGLAR